MIWALLAILIFGGGSSAPFLQVIKSVDKQQKHVLVDKTRATAADQTLRKMKEQFKDYQDSCRKLAPAFESVVKRRSVSTGEYQDVLKKFDAAEKSWEDKHIQIFMDYKSQFSPQEWKLLFKGVTNQ